MPSFARAPPLQQLLRPPRAGHRATDEGRLRLGRWLGLWTGAVWGAFLIGLLLGLGRVPWLEASAWSLGSAVIVARTAASAWRRLLDHWLGPATLELGPGRPQHLRACTPKVLARRGYRLVHHTLGLDVYQPRIGAGILPPLRISWSGPGACIDGPRFLVRRLAIVAASC